MCVAVEADAQERELLICDVGSLLMVIFVVWVVAV